MTSNFPPAKPSKPIPGKPPFPINLDEIARQPKEFIKTTTQSFGVTPSSPAPETAPQINQQEAQEKLVAQQKITQLRTQIEQEMAGVAKQKETDRPTARFSQDQPPSPPEEQNAILNPPSAPKKHLMPGQAARRKATQIETRAKVAGT